MLGRRSRRRVQAMQRRQSAAAVQAILAVAPCSWQGGVFSGIIVYGLDSKVVLH